VTPIGFNKAHRVTGFDQRGADDRADGTGTHDDELAHRVTAIAV